MANVARAPETGAWRRRRGGGGRGGRRRARGAASTRAALGRRDALRGTTTTIATMTTVRVTEPARAADRPALCGYFDEFSGGLAPRYAFDTPWNEGFVDASAVFVRGVGDYRKAKKAKKAPVLAVTNGPGIAHGYMSALETLSGEAGGAREVFFYDQRGSGKSKGASSYDLALYLDELRTVARELRLVEEGGAHVLAHGYWGARLATTLAAEVPGFARSVTLVAPTATRRREVADWRRALEDISKESRDAILDYEEDLDPSKRAMNDRGLREFSERFVSIRGDRGACFNDVLAPRSSDAPRNAITGGKYFSVAGSLANDVIDLRGLGEKLGKNGVRAVRVIRGERDAVTQSSAREIVDAINAESSQGAPFCAYDEIENAGSCAFLDRGDYFFETLNICVEKADD